MTPSRPAPPRQPSLFGPDAPGRPGAYGPRRRGVYDDAECPTCGEPSESHPTVAVCYRGFPVKTGEGR